MDPLPEALITDSLLHPLWCAEAKKTGYYAQLCDKSI